MSDIRRWEDDYFRYEGDQMTEDPEGRFVLYTDHAEAVAALTSFAVKQIMGEEEDTRRDLLASYEQGKVDERKRSFLLIADAYKQGRERGQRDALAAAVQRVEALIATDLTGPESIWDLSAVIAAIKGDSDDTAT